MLRRISASRSGCHAAMPNFFLRCPTSTAHCDRSLSSFTSCWSISSMRFRQPSRSLIVSSERIRRLHRFHRLIKTKNIPLFTCLLSRVWLTHSRAIPGHLLLYCPSCFFFLSVSLLCVICVICGSSLTQPADILLNRFCSP